MQKYVIETSFSKHSIEEDGDKSQANDDNGNERIFYERNGFF